MDIPNGKTTLNQIPKCKTNQSNAETSKSTIMSARRMFVKILFLPVLSASAHYLRRREEEFYCWMSDTYDVSKKQENMSLAKRDERTVICVRDQSQKHAHGKQKAKDLRQQLRLVKGICQCNIPIAVV